MPKDSQADLNIEIFSLAWASRLAIAASAEDPPGAVLEEEESEDEDEDDD